MTRKLFIPGPIDVREDVLQRMATPMIGHRGKDASALQKGISEITKNVTTASLSFALRFGATAVLLTGKPDVLSILRVIEQRRPSILLLRADRC